MAEMGVIVKEKATETGTPSVAESGVAFAAGTAPAHTAAKPAGAGVPVLCRTWEEAVEKLGYSEDWEKYTLCEVMYSHFKLYRCGPVIFCNAFDPGRMKKEGEARILPVREHAVALPFETLREGLEVKNGETALTEDRDFVVTYGESGCVLELLPGGPAYDAAELSVAAPQGDPSQVTETEAALAIDGVDSCLNTVGTTPDLLLAPGWSRHDSIAALLTEKAWGVCEVLKAKALIDADSSAAGVTRFSDLPAYKSAHWLTDKRQILCWPMASRGEKRFHLSTQLAGSMARIDAANDGCPVESPSNMPLEIDGCCLADGTPVSLTWTQAKEAAGNYGVVTALYFGEQGWTAKGNYTACHPQNKDEKDRSIPVSRMFDWVGNTLVKTYWSKLDRPMRRRLIDNIQDNVNMWLLGLVGAEKLLGGRVEFQVQENPVSDLIEGVIKFHISLTPPSAAQAIVFTLEYDAAYLAAALTA